MAKTPNEEIAVRRVKAISGGITVGNSAIGVSVRYLVGEDRCEINVRYRFRLKVFRKTITISASTGWQGCEDGIATAFALAEKFDAEEIELCDPDGHLTDTMVEETRKMMREAR